MQVDVLRATEDAERLVCQAARGDYYEGYVGDTEYAELMSGVRVSDTIIRDVFPEWTGVPIPENDDPQEWLSDEPNDYDGVVEARTRAFVEKQLSRGHYGPWEHPQITFSVKGVSRVTMAQITRHRHLTFDIQSMRYADFSDTDIITPVSLMEDEHVSRETGIVNVDNQDILLERYKSAVGGAVADYRMLVKHGIPKEDARFILPLGTPVNMTFSGNARTFMHLLDMRAKADAQWEIRELSELLIKELKDWMPYSYSFYEQSAPHKLAP